MEPKPTDPKHSKNLQDIIAEEKRKELENKRIMSKNLSTQLKAVHRDDPDPNKPSSGKIEIFGMEVPEDDLDQVIDEAMGLPVEPNPITGKVPEKIVWTRNEMTWITWKNRIFWTLAGIATGLAGATYFSVPLAPESVKIQLLNDDQLYDATVVNGLREKLIYINQGDGSTKTLEEIEQDKLNAASEEYSEEIRLDEAAYRRRVKEITDYRKNLEYKVDHPGQEIEPEPEIIDEPKKTYEPKEEIEVPKEETAIEDPIIKPIEPPKPPIKESTEDPTAIEEFEKTNPYEQSGKEDYY